MKTEQCSSSFTSVRCHTITNTLPEPTNNVTLCDPAINSGLDSGAEHFYLGLVFELRLLKMTQAGAEHFAGIGVLATLNSFGNISVEFGG
jgi:hypothetical protein